MKSKIPPKKKESNGNYKPVAEVHADHELFLQAFEKPTQIYRYLRTRNILSPIFLQRNLYYMKGRMSRTHKNRANFKIDELLHKVLEESQLNMTLPGTSLNLVFTAFNDSKLENVTGDVARIETQVVKILHKKRKESASPSTQDVRGKFDSSAKKNKKCLVSMGTCDVSINPPLCDNIENLKSSTLSIPTSNFHINNGNQVKSYMLSFKITLVHDQENGEPVFKRRRLSRASSQETSQNDCTMNGHTNGDVNGYSSNGSPCYTAELIVYDKMSRCQLSPGQYEVVAHSCKPDQSPCKTSPRKYAVWEKLDISKFESQIMAFQNSPVLIIKLTWTEDSSQEIEKPKIKRKQCLDIALANCAAAKPRRLGVASPEAPQLVLYQFIYNNNNRQQTESRRDFHCPWCSLNCCRLYSLLKHLKLCHARFSFTYVPHSKGARIDVSLNECFDGSYAGNPHDLSGKPSGCSFTRAGPTRRTPTTGVLVCRPKRTKPSLSEFLEQDESDFDVPRPYILGHNRMYHHTMICLPVQPHELDIDSEGEHDSEWVRTKTKMMIDEFSDVNEGEKELMKMWNLHVMKFNFVGDCQIPKALHLFLQVHGKDILQKQLYRNFILHMASLHDFGLVGSGVMYKCILELQKLMSTESMKNDAIQYLNFQLQNSSKPFTASPTKPNLSFCTDESSDDDPEMVHVPTKNPILLKIEDIEEELARD